MEIKKYDIFTFNNELDLLEIRLNILNKYVDYFVIVEATETFSGIPKPLYYQLNKDRFKEFEDKIIHYVITDTPQSFDDKDCNQEALMLACNSDNVTREHLCWLKEFYQKELIKNALVGLNDEDICYFSDLDEIWNYNLDFVIEDRIYKPMVNWCYINYLNVRTNENWTYFTGPIVTKYKNVKNECLNHLRTPRKNTNVYVYIENGGWHFNAIGGIQKKIDAFKHPVYTNGYMLSREHGSRIDENDLPDYLKENKEKYKTLFA
jgi:beta-1,4-mannosyl-glycoprotein beta-1,4-N-acetylglucosaminyltransferase